MALVDMLNAGGQCDLLEVRLDRFEKAPDFGDLLSARTKPVIMSCRRTRDGGYWDASEEERRCKACGAVALDGIVRGERCPSCSAARS